MFSLLSRTEYCGWMRRIWQLMWRQESSDKIWRDRSVYTHTRAWIHTRMFRADGGIKVMSRNGPDAARACEMHDNTVCKRRLYPEHRWRDIKVCVCVSGGLFNKTFTERVVYLRLIDIIMSSLTVTSPSRSHTPYWHNTTETHLLWTCSLLLCCVYNCTMCVCV